ncbi:hypothetical protein GDO78_013798 [Eleutherodactylus coqui]|uniref:Uncharacterized protein n=1 Tax=Eleutherodactylus coqui TaxID=57060 RepID=A0A8J6ELJ8_ELECQ|nr:hypothetical protein GDO78_013798 [Eleutherodactylus coqui]
MAALTLHCSTCHADVYPAVSVIEVKQMSCSTGHSHMDVSLAIAVKGYHCAIVLLIAESPTDETPLITLIGSTKARNPPNLKETKALLSITSNQV